MGYAKKSGGLKKASPYGTGMGKKASPQAVKKKAGTTKGRSGKK